MFDNMKKIALVVVLILVLLVIGCQGSGDNESPRERERQCGATGIEHVLATHIVQRGTIVDLNRIGGNPLVSNWTFVLFINHRLRGTNLDLCHFDQNKTLYIHQFNSDGTEPELDTGETHDDVAPTGGTASSDGFFRRPDGNRTQDGWILGYRNHLSRTKFAGWAKIKSWVVEKPEIKTCSYIVFNTAGVNMHISGNHSEWKNNARSARPNPSSRQSGDYRLNVGC